MGKKKVKDPLAPKPPLNSYMEFALEERSEVLKDLGQVSIKEVGKEIGSRWKKLDEEAKQKYVLKSRQNQELYKIEKQKYEQNKPVEQNEYPPSDTMMNQKKKKKKHPLAPKLPLSSYMEFAKEQRPKVLSDLGNLSLGEVGKELGRRWQKLGELEKSVYEDKYSTRLRWKLSTIILLKIRKILVLILQNRSQPTKLSLPLSRRTSRSLNQTPSNLNTLDLLKGRVLVGIQP